MLRLFTPSLALFLALALAHPEQAENKADKAWLATFNTFDPANGKLVAVVPAGIQPLEGLAPTKWTPFVERSFLAYTHRRKAQVKDVAILEPPFQPGETETTSANLIKGLASLNASNREALLKGQSFDQLEPATQELFLTASSFNPSTAQAIINGAPFRAGIRLSVDVRVKDPRNGQWDTLGTRVVSPGRGFDHAPKSISPPLKPAEGRITTLADLAAEATQDQKIVIDERLRPIKLYIRGKFTSVQIVDVVTELTNVPKATFRKNISEEASRRAFFTSLSAQERATVSFDVAGHKLAADDILGGSQASASDLAASSSHLAELFRGMGMPADANISLGLSYGLWIAGPEDLPNTTISLLTQAYFGGAAKP